MILPVNLKSISRCARLVLAAAGFLTGAQIVHAQQSILGGNLIVNGNAEAGPAGKSGTDVVIIPSWTRNGNATVLPYGLPGGVLTSDPAPPDHLFQYFKGPVGGATLIQNIDVSSGAAIIAGNNVKYTVSAYLGALAQGSNVPVKVTVDFKNAAGQIFTTATIGPDAGFPGAGLSMQQRVGLVPVGTATITVTLALGDQFAAADSLSLVLSALGTTPASVLGANLIVNGNAEAGQTGTPDKTAAPYVPGWSTTGSSVCPYGGAGWILTADPGPSDRGTNLFCGYFGNSNSYQYIDVSPASAQIDAGQIKYQVGAWLGSLSGYSSPTLTYYFYDWTGKQLAPTAQIGPVAHTGTALIPSSHSDVLPAGTRLVLISLTFPNFANLADDVSFTIGNANAPVITSGGIVPVYSPSTTIEPGSWVSIYGTGLAGAITSWNGDFPKSLGATSVTINGKSAYLWFVSPTQINLQAPDDTATGSVPVVVTTAAGSFTSTVTLGQYSPSFSLYNNKYAAAIVITPGAAGNSGNGYDYIGPANALPFASRPVRAGETLLLYGVGFGPTTPLVAAGAAFSGAAQCPVLPSVTIGGVSATVSFAGIVEAGLFQFNVVVPSAGTGDQLLVATIGGMTTPANVFVTLR